MADFSTLIATLRATIKTNYNQEITGQILQDDLLAIVDAVNRLKQDTLEGYAFHGAPLADGASVSVTQNTFFLVAEGEYTINGSTIEVDAAGVSVIVYDSVNNTTNWHTLFSYDTTPTAASKNAITSGAVAAALAPLATKEDVEAVEQEVAQIAGEAGLAEAVIDTDGAGTEQEFTFRKSGGDGGAYYRKIKGKTIVVDAQLASNDAEAVETTGVNQWDEEWESGVYSNGIKVASPDRIRCKNPIPCFPSTMYKVTVVGEKSNTTFEFDFLDDNGNFISTLQVTNDTFETPGNCHYFVFCTPTSYYGTTYNHDICINLSNPAINGQYFPYWKRTLQLDITTRKDTDGNVPFPNGLQSCPVAQDEATKEGGTIRVGTRAYQAGDESDANVITDGTNTNYALTTPVPFTWAEPLNLGVKVDENGTEKAVAPEGATAPSAPFVADTTYTMSVARMVEILKNL